MLEYLNLPMILVLLGALFSAVGVFMATARQNQEKLQATAARLQFEQELRAKSEEIAALNKTLASTVTGGDSYCYFLVPALNPDSKLIDLMLMHHGDFPLYDVSVQIEDVDKLLELVRGERAKGTLPYKSITEAYQLLGQAATVINVGNFGPNQMEQLGAISIPARGRLAYNVKFLARNGGVFQRIRFQRVAGEWKRAWQIARDNDILEEHVDPDFPRSAAGEPIW